MPTSFPCATCGASLSDNTFQYQKHMTIHWSDKNNCFPLPSIFTTSSIPSPTSHPCFFCDFAFDDIHKIASHMITSHSSDLHSILCPKAIDKSLRESVFAFLDDFAASGAGFVALCDCFPGHPAHMPYTVPSVLGKRKRSAADSGLGMSPTGVTPNITSKRVYLYPFEPSAP